MSIAAILMLLMVDGYCDCPVFASAGGVLLLVLLLLLRLLEAVELTDSALGLLSRRFTKACGSINCLVRDRDYGRDEVITWSCTEVS